MAFLGALLCLIWLALPACRSSAPEPNARRQASGLLAARSGTSLASTQSERALEPKPGTRLAISERCSKVCARSAPLSCAGASECQSFCEELATSLACHLQMDAVLDCFAQEPTEHWECVEEGLPALRDGHCSDEQAAYRACRAKDE